MAGYSGTPLARKLGIKPAHRLLLIDAPDGAMSMLGSLPHGVSVRSGLRSRALADVILLFCSDARSLGRRWSSAAERLDWAGGLWVCWPKRASGIATDLAGDAVREHGLAGGLVDNKVCALDETWSGLRFVVRVSDRPKG